ncbi:unnamed protein product [Absidia cylindrospora]
MASIPSSVLKLVADYIDIKDMHACTLTNKAFYAATNPLLWEEAYLQTFRQGRLFLRCLCSAKNSVGQHVRMLRLDARNDLRWTDDELVRCLQHCPDLEVLTLFFMEYITDAGFLHVPRLCPKINHLSLCHVSGLTDASFQLIGQHCHQLKRLYMFDNNHISKNTFATLAGCTLLKDVSLVFPIEPLFQHPRIVLRDLAQFRHLTDVLFQFPPRVFLRQFLSMTWPRLENVGIVGYEDTETNANDDLLVKFLRTHRGLKTLRLPMARFSRQWLVAITALRHPGITHLNLAGYNMIFPVFVFSATGGGDGRVVTAGSIRRLVRRWPALKCVSLDGCMIRLQHFPEMDKGCMISNNPSFWQFPSKQYLAKLNHITINKIRQSPAAARGGSQ